VGSIGDRLRSLPGAVSLTFHEQEHGKVDTYAGSVLTSETVDALYKERDFCSMEFAFLQLEIETGFLESFEDQMDMVLVFFKSIGIDQEIIKVDNKEFIEVVVKFVIYEVLECYGRVT
jgi:hypothetical protein